MMSNSVFLVQDLELLVLRKRSWIFFNIGPINFNVNTRGISKRRYFLQIMCTFQIGSIFQILCLWLARSSKAENLDCFCNSYGGHSCWHHLNSSLYLFMKQVMQSLVSLHVDRYRTPHSIVFSVSVQIYIFTYTDIFLYISMVTIFSLEKHLVIHFSDMTTKLKYMFSP